MPDERDPWAKRGAEPNDEASFLPRIEIEKLFREWSKDFVARREIERMFVRLIRDLGIEVSSNFEDPGPENERTRELFTLLRRLKQQDESKHGRIGRIVLMFGAATTAITAFCGALTWLFLHISLK